MKAESADWLAYFVYCTAREVEVGSPITTEQTIHISIYLQFVVNTNLKNISFGLYPFNLTFVSLKIPWFTGDYMARNLQTCFGVQGGLNSLNVMEIP